MKVKIQPIKPSVILLFGYPGSGKTTFANHLSQEISYAHINADKLLSEALGPGRSLSQKEVLVILLFITREFIKAGVGVILDVDLPRRSARKAIREFASKNRIKSLTVWLQIDADTAQRRLASRDKRKAENRYAKDYTPELYQAAINNLQNPKDEDYIVISGKHNFRSQKTAVINRLYQMGVLKMEEVNRRVAKPELMSLVPKPTLGGETMPEQRNISIN